MNKIGFSITIVTDFLLDIIEFHPATDIGERWSFESEINGPNDSDGLTAFKEVIVRASTLPKDEGCKLLFAKDLSEGATHITGEDRIKTLASRKLADPDLLWSLYREKDQKTLRYLHDTYGVTWMESLRRVIRNRNGYRFSLYLSRKGDGSWGMDCFSLSSQRHASSPTLVLGE